VWGAVADYVRNGRTDFADVTSIQTVNDQTNLMHLIEQLGQQMQKMNPDVFGQRGMTQAMGGAVHQFLHVSAMPYNEKGPETKNMVLKLRELMLSIDHLRLIDSEDATKEANDIKERVSKKPTPDLTALLIMYAGLNDRDAAKFLGTAQTIQGNFEPGEKDVESALAGNVTMSNEKGVEALEVALKMLMPEFARQGMKTLGRRYEQKLASYRVQIVPEDKLDPRVTQRKGGLLHDRKTIQLGVPEGLSGRELVYYLVGSLDHEINHNFILGAPNEVAEEALVGYLTSTTLRGMGLAYIADLVDMVTYQRIAKLKQSRALIIPRSELGDLRVANDATAKVVETLLSLVKKSNGTFRPIIINPSDGLMNPGLIDQLQKGGVEVINLKAISQMIPDNDETKLEVYARLQLGVPSVGLVINPNNVGDWTDILTKSGTSQIAKNLIFEALPGVAIIDSLTDALNKHLIQSKQA
jgi:hypothetical protein